MSQKQDDSRLEERGEEWETMSSFLFDFLIILEGVCAWVDACVCVGGWGLCVSECLYFCEFVILTNVARGQI